MDRSSTFNEPRGMIRRTAARRDARASCVSQPRWRANIAIHAAFITAEIASIIAAWLVCSVYQIVARADNYRPPGWV
jgi:hypothetical protein